MTTFYLEPLSTDIWAHHVEYRGKGWYRSFFKGVSETFRNPYSPTKARPSNYYFVRVSLFAAYQDNTDKTTWNLSREYDTLFNYAKGHCSDGQIHNYGTKDYTLEASWVRNAQEYTVHMEHQEVKVRLGDWEYLVLNWIPSDPITFQVTYKLKPLRLENKEIVYYESPVYSDKEEAIKDFYKQYERIKDYDQRTKM